MKQPSQSDGEQVQNSHPTQSLSHNVEDMMKLVKVSYKVFFNLKIPSKIIDEIIEKCAKAVVIVAN